MMLSVGDVSGHGVDASRMMAKLRHATRAYACLDSDLPSLVDHLDLFLAQFGEEAQIATTLLVRLDPATGEFACVSAGHPPPLLVGSTGSRFLEVVHGPPLGAFREHAPGPRARSVLHPGSALLLYTDGLVERRGESIEDGLERLRLGVPAEPASAEALCRAALDACIEVVQDDVCVLALVRAPD
jgi:serine phosphatase RsbU (regulator of sigma subunit)